MLTPISSNNPWLEHSKNILRAYDPGIDSETLHLRAEGVAKITEFLIDSSSSLGVLRCLTQDLVNLSDEMLSPPNQALLRSTLIEFEIGKEKIFRQVTLEQQPDLEGKWREEMSQAAAESIKKAKDLQKQTCKTCHIPNQCISIEGSDIQYLLKKCDRCKKAMYCSEACQRLDWPYHWKFDCL